MTGWCEYHGWHEPSQPGDFRSCGECGHVWRTRDDFVEDVRWLDNEMRESFPDWPRQDPKKVAACPLCSHDW